MTLLWLFALVGLIGWALAQALMPFAVRALTLYPAAPGLQPRRVLLVGALPWLVPLAFISTMALFAAAKSFGWVADHCLEHAPHHPHFCFEHLPEMLLGHGHAHVFLVASLLAMLAFQALRYGWRLRHQSASLTALTALSKGKGLLRLLEDSRPMAFASGGKQPHIYLSNGLIEKLDRHERRMVLAHEAAHIRHRDLPSSRLLECLLLLHCRPYAKQLNRLWCNAIEVRADEQVARRFGRTATAELLLRLAKTQSPGQTAVAFGGGDTTARIYRLLNEVPNRQKTVPLFEGVFALGLLVLMAALWANHHSMETLVGILVRL